MDDRACGEVDVAGAELVLAPGGIEPIVDHLARKLHPGPEDERRPKDLVASDEGGDGSTHGRVVGGPDVDHAAGEERRASLASPQLLLLR